MKGTIHIKSNKVEIRELTIDDIRERNRKSRLKEFSDLDKALSNFAFEPISYKTCLIYFEYENRFIDLFEDAVKYHYWLEPEIAEYITSIYCKLFSINQQITDEFKSIR